MRSLATLVKQYNMKMEEDDIKLEITLQSCNDFMTCYGRSKELICTDFLHDGIYSIRLYPNI